MPRLRTPLTPLHLRALLRCFSTSESQPLLRTYPHRGLVKPSFISPPSHHDHYKPSPAYVLFSLSSSKPYSSTTDSFSKPVSEDSELETAKTLSAELLKDPNSEDISLLQRLELSFSHVNVTPYLILATLNISPDAGRTVLGFLQWVNSRPNVEPSDEIFSYFIDYLGRRKDFKATHDVLVAGRGIIGAKSLESAIDRLVRAGRTTQVVSFFENMEKDYGFARNKDSLKLIVKKLCEPGFANHAEKMVKNLANEFFPDEWVCDYLIKGWCINGKLDEAKRLAIEMERGGFGIGAIAYNAMLDCVCKLCIKKNLPLESEAEKILIEMEKAGVPRTTETFNVLIENLCKIRKTDDALNLFYNMGEWGCSPNEKTFIVLIRSLYQAARVEEGDEMIDQMKSAGFQMALKGKVYHGFLKILCGIQRIDHAMIVFLKMKEDLKSPGVKTYELLLTALCNHGRGDEAKDLYEGALSNSVPLEAKPDKFFASFVKKPEAVKEEKKGKKRLTLPEKMALKRTRLRKIRLSYVKKPKKTMRRAF